MDKDLEADFKRLDQENSRGAVDDGYVLVRIREVLRKKGFNDAAFAIDRFDAHLIRTGRVHPVMDPEVLEARRRLLESSATTIKAI